MTKFLVVLITIKLGYSFASVVFLAVKNKWLEINCLFVHVLCKR